MLPETPTKTVVKPPLVPQEHGGAIYRGGLPGNKGGGRPKSVVKAACLRSFDERIPVLESIADGEPVQKIEFPAEHEETYYHRQQTPVELAALT